MHKDGKDLGHMRVHYRVTVHDAAPHRRALDIAIEQSVEAAEELCRRPSVWEVTVGRVLAVTELGPGQAQVVIEYPGALLASDPGQVFSVLFGNISLQKGIEIQRVELGRGLWRAVGGPAFGFDGVLQACGQHKGPLLAAALKPLGLPVETLAELAYALAVGGVDLIKDDHGITDQPVCPFHFRVEAVQRQLDRARARTGKRCLYFPSITGPHDELLSRALFAKAVGAGGVLVSPFVVGIDALRLLRDEAALPIMAHPALAGAFFPREGHGISPGVVLGTLLRLVGADLVVFPGPGGRFPFTPGACCDIARALRDQSVPARAAGPVVAGGMTPEKALRVRDLLGDEMVFLVGSALYTASPDVARNVEQFNRALESRP